MCQSVDMNKSGELHRIVVKWLVEDQSWDCRNNIKDEVAGQVVPRDLLNLSVGSCLLHKIEKDLDQVENINEEFQSIKLNLRISSWFIISIFIFSLIDILKDDNEWADK